MGKGVTIAAALVCALSAGAVAHAADKPYSPPRTSYGKPDLTGVWSNASVTNLTRSPGVSSLVVDQAQAAKLAKDSPFEKLAEAEEGPSNLNDNLLKDGNNDRGYNTFWIDPGKSLANVKGQYRTSWIVEPANGQMPLSDAGRKLLTAARDQGEGQRRCDRNAVPHGFSSLAGARAQTPAPVRF